MTALLEHHRGETRDCFTVLIMFVYEFLYLICKVEKKKH